MRLGIAQGGSSFLCTRQGRLLAPDHGCVARFVSVNLDPHYLISRKIRAFADSVYGAGGNAGGAIDACNGIDVHALIVTMETRHRTNENAIRESTAATVPGNHMGHCRSSFKHQGENRLTARRGHDS
jgi:hypothetical protein